MQKILLAIVFLLAPALCLADAGDTNVIEVWNCKIKDGKTEADVRAHNTKWLAYVRQTSPEINSYGMERIVGTDGSFMFADAYPDLATWAAAKKSLDSDAGNALDMGFAELVECDSNRLYNTTEH
jgi:hypothetical protein